LTFIYAIVSTVLLMVASVPILYRMDVRLRIPELMAARGWKTAYALSRESGGRITLPRAYRLVKSEGRLDTFGADVLELLCATFGVTPGELFETDAEESARLATERAAKRKR
jgi:hypothetical protein